ncbi:serine hydrolase [Loigolactobacillus backii]|uniref:Serine hydrolase n=1 Tax=Loigolactobacillus backii TaxID=375175 RepID=A0A192H4C5_9LACO|nr:serine hydrolase domain-containing protein [Loigolactobacillus backii]ANK63225.1 serine hydrolase [Loigolactobacillus backii]ANK69769.1 serine hydrolase [Loigolactobacillus backii]PIO83763.1 serine hydrolase [Loigolactobacillus backii]
MYDKTQAELAALVTDGVVPGVHYAFINGRTTEEHYFGYSELKPDKKLLKANQLYDLASLTKVIATTTLILELQEAGRLSVNDPLQWYIPSFQDSRVTLRHFLTHTSGISGYIPHRNSLSAAKLTYSLLGLTTGAGFGREVKYSDTGLIYCGWVIERLLHLPVQDALTQYVLRPLGMLNSTFTPEKKLCVPASYEPGGRGLIQGVVHDPKAHILGKHCGSAGLFAPMSDLILFARFMLGDALVPRPPISQTTINSLYHDYTGFSGGRSLGWNLKTSVEADQHKLLFHTGYVGSFILLDGKKDAAFIFLSNRIHPIAPNEAYLAKRDHLIDTYLTEKAQE